MYSIESGKIQTKLNWQAANEKYFYYSSNHLSAWHEFLSPPPHEKLYEEIIPSFSTESTRSLLPLPGSVSPSFSLRRTLSQRNLTSNHLNDKIILTLEQREVTKLNHSLTTKFLATKHLCGYLNFEKFNMDRFLTYGLKCSNECPHFWKTKTASEHKLFSPKS